MITAWSICFVSFTHHLIAGNSCLDFSECIFRQQAAAEKIQFLNDHCILCALKQMKMHLCRSHPAKTIAS
jgi:hypothetical protein